MRINNTFEKEIKENLYLIESIKNPLIKARSESNLKWFIRKAVKNKYYYYLCTIITILCPIISEIILLLPIQNNTYPRVISGIVLGISSLVAALLPLFDFRKKWGIYRNQAEELKTILVEMSGNDGKNENDLLHKMEESVRETHENWMEPFKTDK